MYHLLFVISYVLGGAAFAVNAAGHTSWGTGTNSVTIDQSLIAECQRLMLLAHASVTAGMKLIGFAYDKPKYVVPSIPPFSLLIISLISLGLGTLLSSSPLLFQLSQKILGISIAAVSLDIVLCIRYRRRNNLVMALALLGLNLLQQAVSGWKGNLLWTTITLAVMLYPLMPKRVLIGGLAFMLFWALYFYPFGLALRPLLWYEGVEQDRAVEMSMERALNMSLDERLETVWGAMVVRANDLNQFVNYVEYVPANHPYYQFDIVSDAMIALVPRVVWSDKPDMEKISMQRVYEAGIVSRQAQVSAKSNYYQDAYLSWGAGGVILACLFFGALAMLFSRICERLFGGYEIGTCLIYTSFFSTIVNQPPNFEFYVGGMAIAVVLIFGIFALGRAAGWIVPANKLAQMPDNRKLDVEDQRSGARPLSGAVGISSHLLRFRR